MYDVTLYYIIFPLIPRSEIHYATSVAGTSVWYVHSKHLFEMFSKSEVFSSDLVKCPTVRY